MLRINLSTRPFYNERVVRVWLVAAGLLLAAATALNAAWLLSYSRSDTELARAAAEDEARAAELSAAAARLRASVDAQQIAAASEEARQANELIDRRTFSWTELFNRFEATLPEDVRITSIRPSVGIDRRPVVTITVVSRGGVDAVDDFMENLEGTGAFADLLSREDRLTDTEQVEAILEMVYLPASTPAGAGPASSSAAPRGRPAAGDGAAAGATP